MVQSWHCFQSIVCAKMEFRIKPVQNLLIPNSGPKVYKTFCEKVHLSSAYSACCRVLYSLKAVTPELTTAAEGPLVPLKL